MEEISRESPLKKIAQKIAQKIAVFLSPLLMRGFFAKLMRLLEMYAAIVQGKGSGAGWDIQGEAKVAYSCILQSNLELNLESNPDSKIIIFDVGANRGEWSQNLIKFLDSKAYHIFLFEPSSACLEILRSLSLPNSTIIPAAVNEKAGNLTLYSPDPTSEIASLHRRRDSYFQDYQFSEQQVQAVTIDDMIAQHQIERVDFMKLDVEGNELSVLRGAKKALEAKRIKALSFEFGSGNINSRTYFHDFWDLLHSCGYRLQRICPGGKLLAVVEYYEDLEYFRGVSNYIATCDRSTLLQSN